ncbi:MAG: radical SAM protein [Lentisphaerae bacterium]|nr:radical SAM protein [Lentisphaerota bacterium]
MTFFEEKIKREAHSREIVQNNRKKLIADGMFPQQFSKPLNLQFELTENCNLRCRHCYNRSGLKSHIDAVSPEKWIDFCQHLVSGGGIFQVTLSGGEPLLLGDKLWKIMDVLHRDGTVFNLISNGFLFTKDTLQHMLNYNFYWVQISIDDFRSAEHDNFRGVRGCWKKAASAAYQVALSGIPLRIATTVTPRNLKYLENMIHMAINLGASYHVIGEVMPSGRAYDNQSILLSDKERDFFYSEMDRLQKKYKHEINIYVSSTQKNQLLYISAESISGAIIRPNGNIRLDCSCPFVIGNILTDDIFKIWKEKANCWQNPLVKKYIESCNPNNGFNTYLENYNQDDIYI